MKFDSHEHILRTTAQWNSSSIAAYPIPCGALCIEITPDNQIRLKVGTGDKFYRQLPYASEVDIDLSDYYTKEEIDRILQNMHMVTIPSEEIYDDVSKLPQTGNTFGQIRFVKNPDTSGDDPIEYLWNNHKWILFGGGSIIDIDLSEYAKKSEVNPRLTKLESTAHTHNNKSILDQITAPYTTNEKSKLESLYNYDDTQINTRIDQLESTAHTHNNKQILDQITAPYTTAEKAKLSTLTNYTLPPATAESLGGIKVGTGLAVTSDGTLSATGGGSYVLPIASASILGGVKIGTGLSIDGNGVLSATGGSSYTLPIASASILGGIKVGTGLTIDASGVLSATGGSSYTLPIASASTLGGIKVGSNLSIDGNGVLSTHAPYTLPVATANDLGGVKVGSNLTIDQNGVMSTHAPYVLPPATTSTLGGIIVGSNLSVDQDGVLSTHAPYSLPIASANDLGGIKVGSNLSIDGNGVLSTHAPYSLPTASNSTLGGIKVGDELHIDSNGVLSGNTYVEGDGIRIAPPDSYEVLSYVRSNKAGWIYTGLFCTTGKLTIDLKFNYPIDVQTLGQWQFIVLTYDRQTNAYKPGDAAYGVVNFTSPGSRLSVGKYYDNSGTVNSWWYYSNSYTTGDLQDHCEWTYTTYMSTYCGTGTLNGTIPANDEICIFQGRTDVILYWMKIYDDTTMIADLVPVRNMTTNEIGLYNRVDDTFLPITIHGSPGNSLIGGTATGEIIGDVEGLYAITNTGVLDVTKNNNVDLVISTINGNTTLSLDYYRLPTQSSLYSGIGTAGTNETLVEVSDLFANWSCVSIMITFDHNGDTCGAYGMIPLDFVKAVGTTYSYTIAANIGGQFGTVQFRYGSDDDELYINIDQSDITNITIIGFY